MFDEKERREEIKKQIEKELIVFIDLLPTSLTQLGISTRVNFWYNKELIEARLMIAKAKKEARKEFAERLKNNNFNNDLEVDYLADKLLEKYKKGE
jgi:guanylate kinase